MIMSSAHFHALSSYIGATFIGSIPTACVCSPCRAIATCGWFDQHTCMEIESMQQNFDHADLNQQCLCMGIGVPISYMPSVRSMNLKTQGTTP